MGDGFTSVARQSSADSAYKLAHFMLGDRSTMVESEGPLLLLHCRQPCPCPNKESAHANLESMHLWSNLHSCLHMSVTRSRL